MRPRGIEKPRGISLDNHGNIYITSDRTWTSNSHNVIQLCSDMSQHSTIIDNTDLAKGYGDIGFHPNGKRFFIAFWEPDHPVEIHQLE